MSFCQVDEAFNNSLKKQIEEYEKDRIIKANGNIIDGRINNNINISRSIGNFEYKKNI